MPNNALSSMPFSNSQLAAVFDELSSVLTKHADILREQGDGNDAAQAQPSGGKAKSGRAAKTPKDDDPNRPK